MNSSTIKQWQARKIHDALFPGRNYLVRLLKRMEKCGFPPDDDLYLHVCAAYDAMQRLSMQMHYLSCSGVGRPS